MSCHFCGGRGYARELREPDGTVLAAADSGWLYCTFCRGDQRAVSASSKILVDTSPTDPLVVLAVDISPIAAALRALPTKSARRAYPEPDESISTIADEHRKRRLRVIQQTSPSQIDLWERCERKWFLSYVFGEKEPQSAAQAAGTDIDDNYVQPHLRGQAPKSGNWSGLLGVMAPLLPAPGAAIVQAELVTPTYDGGPRIIGYPDWMEPLDERTVGVDDLKSTSDFRYVKTREQLVDNTQGLSYARSLFHLIEPLEVVRFRHLYALRNERSPKARWSPGPNDNPIQWTRGEVEQRWASRNAHVERMVLAATHVASSDELEPNTAACGDYGGCPHRARCGLNLGIFGGMKMSATSTTNTPPTSPAGNAGLLAKLNARKAAQTGQPAPSAPPAPAAPAPVEPIGAKPTSPFTILPADAPSRTSTPEQIEAVDAEVKAKARSKKKEPAAEPTIEDLEAQIAAKKAAAQAQQAQQAAAAKASSDAELEAAREEARKAGLKSKIADASAPLQQALAQQDAPKLVVPGVRKRPPEPPVLFVDCVPTKGATAVDLTEWLLDAEEAAAAEYVDAKTGQKGVADWRMIPYSFDGALASAIRNRLDTCPASLIIRSDSRAAKVALEVLIPHAALVVQGAR